MWTTVFRLKLLDISYHLKEKQKLRSEIVENNDHEVLNDQDPQIKHYVHDGGNNYLGLFPLLWIFQRFEYQLHRVVIFTYFKGSLLVQPFGVVEYFCW